MLVVEGHIHMSRKFVKEQLRALIWGSLVVLSGWLLAPATNEFRVAVQKSILNTLSPRALLGLAVVSGLVAVLSFIYAVVVRRSFSISYIKKQHPVDAKTGQRTPRVRSGFIPESPCAGPLSLGS